MYAKHLYTVTSDGKKKSVVVHFKSIGEIYNFIFLFMLA